MQRIYTQIFVLLFIALGVSGCSSMGAAMKASPSFVNSLGFADIPLEDLEERYTNEYSKWANVNGLNIHYQEVGEGPTIVLVHGIMSSLQTWDDWVLELSKSYRVISLDVPGFGLTGAPESMDDFNEEYLLNTFAKFLDIIEVDHMSIAGNSLGGYIAAQYASNYPNRVDRLILLDPVAYPQEVPWIIDFATAPVISTIGGFVQPPLLITLNVKQVYGDHQRIERRHMDRYVHMSQRPGARKSYIKIMEILKERSSQETPLPFAQIKAPTLLMWGEADKWVPVELSKRWNEDIRDSQVVIYPGVGHMPMEEIPSKTVMDAIAFLNGKEIIPPKPISKVKEFSEPGASERMIEAVEE
ncbi:alpha/beta fold hydrolase [Alkalimarinus alittae]|uniref:Alpha/beta hydrolase n=1 Tax=Alkalimarinus alittae TaxID=2961619 RepID=A0ABY6N6Z1_9ALTE|nr:alpha/beta hydrolase [Alkalimarinus alittae]UZE97872.1 alpha/beta hydrolase [Alkalimarinus alittae]